MRASSSVYSGKFRFSLGYAGPIKVLLVTAFLCRLSASASAQGEALSVNWIYSAMNAVHCVAYSSDGKLLAAGGVGSAGSAGVIQVVDVSTRSLLKCLPTTALTVQSIAFSPDGKMLATGGEFNELELWDVSTGKLITTLPTGIDEGINTIAFSPDGTTLADGGSSLESGVVELWNLSTRKVKTLQTAAGSICSVAFSPDSKSLVGGGGIDNGSGVLELWNLTSGKSAELRTAASGGVHSVVFSKNGKTIVAGGSSQVSSGETLGILEVWNFASQNLVKTLSSAIVANIYSIALSTDGNLIADGGVSPNGKGALEVWNVSSGTSKELDTDPAGTVYSIAFSPNGTALAEGGVTRNAHYVGILRFWSVESGTSTVCSTLAYYSVSSTVFSPDSADLAVGGNNYNATTDDLYGMLQLWNTSNGTLTKSFKTAITNVNAVAFSPDGRTLAAAGANSTGGLLELWNASSGKLERVMSDAGANWFSTVAFSPDGRTLAAGGSVLKLWNLASGKVTTLNTAAASVSSIVFSPDGKKLAVCGTANDEGVLEMWNLSAASLIKSFSTAENFMVFSVAFSPDGQTFANGGFEGNVKFGSGLVETWNVSTYDLQSRQTAWAMSLSFSTDGKYLFAGSSERLDVFPMVNGEDGDMYNNIEGFTPFSVSPNGQMLAFSNGLNTLEVAQNPVYGGLAVQSVSVSASTILAGDSSAGTVILGAPAPSGGVTVALASASNAVTLPTGIKVAAGHTSATFILKATSVTTPTTVTLTATVGTSSQVATLTIEPPSLTQVALAPNSVVGGKTSTGTVAIGSAAPVGGLTISLLSSDSSATVPATVTIPAGKTSSTFTVSTTKVTSNTTATITATFGSVSKAAVLTITP